MPLFTVSLTIFEYMFSRTIHPSILLKKKRIYLGKFRIL
ncbi:hypothetical protein B4133_0518 [Bacillus altitudinis]|nr:hypothetical protein B4133_0518 [Bacillus altitudinis]